MTRRRLLLAMAANLAPAVGAAADLAFDLEIERGQLPPNKRVIRVRQGDVVRLRWRTDRPVTLHLHGYDIELTLARGSVAEMTFTARAAGRFPVNVHQGNAGGGHSHQETPLVVVEVYPQ